MDLRWKCQWNQGLGRDFVKDERLAPQRMPWWEFFGAEGMNNGNATILGPTPEKLWESSQRSGFLFKGYLWYPLISLGIVVKKLNRKTQHNTYLLFKKTSSNLIIIPTAGVLPLLGSKRPRQWAMSARRLRRDSSWKCGEIAVWASFSLILYTYIIPICSMYGIFTYIWVIYGVNVGKYSIHGAYGIYT